MSRILRIKSDEKWFVFDARRLLHFILIFKFKLLLFSILGCVFERYFEIGKQIHNAKIHFQSDARHKEAHAKEHRISKIKQVESGR